ncbi:hypothetical protein KFL_001130280 [Klebsormidium nitens]|uniref:Uncharacterized protein n=1 Tax=Klebsormidium nitens TaxID=105231 RepID=A0A0U9HLE3_KLENI|nr:hypothetical protein KFL_001130280 [Klebsormidium nitens]|eukprot:GAQ82510.1 hypothetical protein KFL_001130280 [Klebsormidium nitens]
MKKEMEDMLAHILSEDFVQQYLSRWSGYVWPSSFVRNPHALSGTLRDRFLARLHENRLILEGTLLEPRPARYKDAWGDIAPLQSVFHGTPEANVDCILRQGLLPERRRSGTWDWFGGSPAAAKPFKKLLVFLVLHAGGAAATAALSSQWKENLGHVTLKCASYQLPVGTVELAKFAGF